MSKKSKTENIIEVKSALAEKYQRLAQSRQSQPARERLLRRAERFRSQAANARKQLGR